MFSPLGLPVKLEEKIIDSWALTPYIRAHLEDVSFIETFDCRVHDASQESTNFRSINGRSGGSCPLKLLMFMSARARTPTVGEIRDASDQEKAKLFLDGEVMPP